MKKRDMFFLGGLVLIGVAVYISRKQSEDKVNKIVQRGDKWIFPERPNPPSFPVYVADPSVGNA